MIKLVTFNAPFVFLTNHTSQNQDLANEKKVENRSTWK